MWLFFYYYYFSHVRESTKINEKVLLKILIYFETIQFFFYVHFCLCSLVISFLLLQKFLFYLSELIYFSIFVRFTYLIICYWKFSTIVWYTFSIIFQCLCVIRVEQFTIFQLTKDLIKRTGRINYSNDELFTKYGT